MVRKRIKEAIIAAGGLGTRVQTWSAFAPKEFAPYNNRPGILYILEELAESGIEHVYYVYNPYYKKFIDWFSETLLTGIEQYSSHVQILGKTTDPKIIVKGLTVDFVAEDGPYCDLSSLLSCKDKLNSDDFLLLFADNIFPYDEINPSKMLCDSDNNIPTIIGSTFNIEDTDKKGVVSAKKLGNKYYVDRIYEKPDRSTVDQIRNDSTNDSLFMLEGRFRLTKHFLDSIDLEKSTISNEPKLSKAIHLYAKDYPYHVISVDKEPIDLGAPIKLHPINFGNVVFVSNSKKYLS